MPPPGGRGRGRGRGGHGGPSLPVEQRQQHLACDGAPQTRATGRPLWGVCASDRAGHARGSADPGLSRPCLPEGRSGSGPSRRRLGSAPGFFHTYPHVGGPFRKLEEADNSIDRYLQDRRHPTMFKEQDGVSRMDIAIREAMYWPDGSRRNGPKSQMIEESDNEMRLLLQALVDKYNDDHNRFGDLALELKDVLDYQYISEGHQYYHFNFTTKTKRVRDFGCGTTNLFFVEVKFVKEEDKKLAVSCFCMVKPNDNGHCYGCVNNGSVGMKHPNNVNAYAGGHLDVPSGCCTTNWIDYNEDVKAEEDDIRYMYEGMDDPEFLKEFITLPPGATPMV